jgi:alanyl-tRNA synthetase
MKRAAEQMVEMAHTAQQQEAPPQPAQTASPETQRTADLLTAQNKDLTQRLTKAEADVAELRAELEDAQIQVTEAAAPKLAQANTGVKVSGNRIVISYPASVADLDAKAAAELGAALDRFRNRTAKRKVIITSVEGGEPFSAAKRYAYYRAVNIRNALIAKGVAAAEEISSVIVAPKGEGGGRVEIAF